MNVTVIGAGTMGNGIAHVFAQSGHAVTLVDLDRDRLDAALSTIDANLGRGHCAPHFRRQWRRRQGIEALATHCPDLEELASSVSVPSACRAP